MMQLPPPVFKDIVLVGGGHANVHIIKMFGMQPQPGIRITLICPVAEMPYSGMIPGYVAGMYSREESQVDLCKLCTFGGARLVMAEVCNINTHKKEITCTDGRPPIRYDIVAINVGISPSMKHMNPNGAESLTPVKPIVSFANRWDVIMRRVLTDESGAIKRILIIGGGAGGVELCFAMNYRLKKELTAIGKDPTTVQLVLATRGNTVLAEHNKTVQETALRLMAEKEIIVQFNSEADSVSYETDKQHILCTDGSKIDFFEAIWCTQAAAPAWLQHCEGLDLVDGFIAVKATLQSISAPDVFAVGDVNHMVDNPRPKAGVFAVRAGPPLLANMKHKLYGQDLEDWLPQEQFLSIVGIAPNYALASRGPMCVEGKFIWKLKDKIDRDWLGGYQNLVPMSVQAELDELAASSETQGGSGVPSPKPPTSDRPPEADKGLINRLSPGVQHVLRQQSMRCGGCGSKVGANVLQRALRRLSSRLRDGTRDEIISGVGGVTPGDDAALIRAPLSPCYLVQTIDYFRSFVKDPYLFGQIAAVHALSDIFAMNAEPISAMALCVLPYGPEDKVEDTLVQMLGGAVKVLTDENCTLVGGHTAEGAEDALGLSCQGIVHPDKVLPKGPIGDHCSLIITKAIGTGVLMAGDMKGVVRGRDVNAALQGMLVSNKKASKILFENGCKSCTDVTGFGVLGHLLEMLKYDNNSEPSTDTPSSTNTKIGVKVHLNTVPLLSGAAECAINGVFSTLQPQNMRCGRAVYNPEYGASTPTYPLLFDPQTSGGLLACVPDSVAPTVIAQLRDAGYGDAAVIGHFFSVPGSSANNESYMITAEDGNATTAAAARIVRNDDPTTCPVEEEEILIWLDDAPPVE